jgi:hypothetical protein
VGCVCGGLCDKRPVRTAANLTRGTLITLTTAKAHFAFSAALLMLPINNARLACGLWALGGARAYLSLFCSGRKSNISIICDGFQLSTFIKTFLLEIKEEKFSYSMVQF